MPVTENEPVGCRPLATLVEALQRGWAARESDAGSAGRIDGQLAALRLADAALRDAFGPRAYAERPPQVVLLGPTQVGKSTLCNVLLGTLVAEVSPLAGFTVHAHGFACGCSADDAWTEHLFPGWQRCVADELPREDAERYALSEVDVDAAAWRLGVEGVVVWDTPDFDSVESRAHQQAVFETVALADLIVLVLSKEKYSDQTVWAMLDLIEPLGRRLVICLNKTPDDGRETIEQTVRQRLAERCPNLGDVPIVTCPMLPPGAGSLAEAAPAAVEHLLDRVRDTLKVARRDQRPAGVRALLAEHWDAWLEPVRAEHAALAAWERAVRDGIAGPLEIYRRDYQDDPRRFDAFNRAVGELLGLLEVPGLAPALVRVRRVLTWPARQLFKARTQWRRQRGRVHGAGSELGVLRDALDRLWVSLARDAAKRAVRPEPDQFVWQQLAEQLATRETELRERAFAAADAFRRDFAPQITAAARRLYEALCEHPAMLNALRAARVTADAGAVVVAIKTGGLGAEGLLLAPAMVSVVSMLTEGALGSYMQRVCGDLKRQQLDALHEQVFERTIVPDLLALAESLKGPGIFGISPATLEQAAAALKGGRS